MEHKKIIRIIPIIISFIGGAIIIVGDFPLVYSRIPIFVNTEIGLQNLETLSGNVGTLNYGEKGFKELHTVIKNNRNIPSNSVWIAFSKGPSAGTTIRSEKFSVSADTGLNNAVFIGNESTGIYIGHVSILREWVKEYRKRYFLKIGIILITTGFFLQFIVEIKSND